MKSLRLSFLSIVLALAGSAQAASFTFNVNYFGGAVASLATGSDNPDGQSLLAGDQFRWNINAQNGGQWTVENTANYLFLMAARVDNAAVRIGDWTLTLWNNGSSVFSQTRLGASQQQVHLGADDTNLVAGLVFDSMSLDYLLTSSTPLNPLDDQTTFRGLLPIFGAPELNSISRGITYARGNDNAVPEPGAFALAGLGLLVAGWTRKQRKPSKD